MSDPVLERVTGELSRRSFLRWTVVAAVTATVGWRVLAPARGLRFEGLTHLTQTEARVLAAAYEAVTLEGDPKVLTEAVAFLDRFMVNLSARDFLELRAALQLVEHTPLFFHGLLGRFTSLSLKNRQRCLEGWRSGAVWKRPVFGAVKELSYLHFYSRREGWAAIGYTGPLVGPGGANPAFEARYAELVRR